MPLPTTSCQKSLERDRVGAQPNPVANTEPPPAPSPAVYPVPEHILKLMVPAQGTRTSGFLRGNFIWKIMNPQAMQRSKQANKQTEQKG